jgi:hypothetical protein
MAEPTEEGAMPETTTTVSPPRSFRLIAWIALAWNLIGVATYLMTVTMSAEALAAMPEPERALYAHTPAWVTSAYAIAVFGGTLGSSALLLRKACAVPLFVVSLIGILLQMSHAFFGTAMLAVRGASAAVLPLLIVAIAIYLVWFSMSARSKQWIR